MHYAGQLPTTEGERAACMVEIKLTNVKAFERATIVISIEDFAEI
jgi:hypothetical protein